MIRYSTDAENDIGEIADYTMDVWGEVQANRYVTGLVECFEQIEKMPLLGRHCPYIHSALFRIEQGHHVIFYLPEPTGVFICRVLHQRMMIEYEDFLLSFSENIR